MNKFYLKEFQFFDGEHTVVFNGVVRHDEAALNDVDKVCLRVGFQHVEKPVDFERIVECIAVSSQFIAIYLPKDFTIRRNFLQLCYK